MKHVLGAITVLIAVTGSASAAALAAAPPETANMILIGAGLILGAAISRVRIRRR